MTEINPFGADPAALAEQWARDLDAHQDDQTMPWPRERLAEFLQFADKLPDGTWQHVSIRLADLRAALDESSTLRRELDEARALGRRLLEAGVAIADSFGFLGEHDPDLAHELLPGWLTLEGGAPETWETPHADRQAWIEEGMDATREHDPDLGKDLDYDDDGFDGPSDSAATIYGEDA